MGTAPGGRRSRASLASLISRLRRVEVTLLAIAGRRDNNSMQQLLDAIETLHVEDADVIITASASERSDN